MSVGRRDVWAAVAAVIFSASALIFARQAPQPPPGQGTRGGTPPQGPAGGGPPGRGPQQPMSFFVTSTGKGDGGNLGGLAGADAFCQSLAASAGRGGVTWRAYLSTQGPNAVDARDRIGKGPWYNQRGQVIANSVAELQGDTLEEARIGNFIGPTNSLDEKGEAVAQGQHDILTGSTLEGRAYGDSTRDWTCNNWTSNTNVDAPPGRVADPPPAGTPSARVGHSDKGNIVPSWNSSHPTAGCSQTNLVATGGAGRLYCFAVN